ncbi:MAG: dioxygenase, partial [Fluviibacter sp.]
MTLPTLFVPHGAPTFALRPGAAGAALVALAQKIERPKAIIVVSPHWETREPTVGSAADLETIYDFGGFPNELYTLKYPAHSDLA